MTSKNTKTASELRRRAEEIDRERIRQTPEIMEAISPESAWNLICELRVNQIELKLQNEELRHLHAERKQVEDALHRSAETQTVLREIAEAAVLTQSMDELYRAVHRLVGRVLPAKLFHINLLDEAINEIVVPFKADDMNFIPSHRPLGKGMTEYIMGLGRTTYITPAEMDLLTKAGKYNLAAEQKVKVRHYLGAPLIDSKGKPFGVMVLIQMGENESFQSQDAEVLSIIAAQVSMAIERKQSEEAITAERNLLLTLINSIPDRIYVKDRECRFTLNNISHINAMGAQSQFEILGKTDHDYRAAILADKYFADDQKVMESDNPLYDYEEPTRLPSGKTGTLLVSKVPLHNSKGEVIGLIGISRDITERKKAEEALASSKSQLQTLVNTIPDMIWLKNTEGVYLSCNPVFESFIGASGSDIVGKMDYDFVDKELADVFRESDRAAMSSGKSVVNEQWLTFANDGHQALMEDIKTAMVGANGKIIGVLGIARDITERKLNEIEIREKEAFQQALLSNMDAGVMVIDAESQIIENMNRAAAQMFGRSEEQVVGRMCMNFLCPAIEGRCPTKDLGQDMDYSERELVRADCTRIPILKSVKRIMLGGREKLLEVFVDISAQKNAEESIRRNAKIQTVLKEIAEAAVQEGSLDELYAMVHQSVKLVLPAKNFYIALLNEEQGKIVRPYCVDEFFRIPRQTSSGKSLTEYVMRQETALYLSQSELDRLRERGEVRPLDAPPHDYLGAPLRNSSGKNFGVVALVAAEKERMFKHEDTEVLSIIAVQISMAIERKHLEEELKFNAKTDKLTGLFNRWHITEKIENELERYRRTGHQFSVIIADIDNFKSINDMFGHAGGDCVLKGIADEMNRSVRQYDVAARWGGEEFLCLLPETDIHSAAAIAERIRNRVQEKVFSWQETVLTVSVTFGVSMIKEADTIDELIKRADKALYQGKRSGKDKVIIAD